MNNKLKKFFAFFKNSTLLNFLSEEKLKSFRRFLRKLLVGAALLFVTSLFVQNATKRKTITSDDEQFPLRFSVYHRQNKNDTWDAYFPEISSIRPGRGNFIGAVYESSLENLNDRNLINWNLEIEIDRECYLNNAWNGTVEIRQTRNGEEKRQPPVNLKTASPKDFTIPVIHTQKDLLLIPLQPGDKIIFRPTSEIFIPAKSKSISRIKLGLIFYTEQNTPLMHIENWKISYKFENDFAYNPLSYLFLFFYVLLFIYIGLSFRNKIIRMEKEHDNQIIEQTMHILAKFIDAKDLITGGHSERVAKCSQMLARELKKNKDFCKEIFYCGLLHDCGKIAVPDEIIKKPSSLTEEEYLTIKNHTIYGAEMLKALTSIPEASVVALYHHEHYDGSGYPYGLKGTEIPESARIVSVADSFDTMSNNRYYRMAISPEKIISELKENSGIQFDPAVVKALLNLIEKGKIKI